mgnify:CR=1 FL=1
MSLRSLPLLVGLLFGVSSPALLAQEYDSFPSTQSYVQVAAAAEAEAAGHELLSVAPLSVSLSGRPLLRLGSGSEIGRAHV